QEKNLESTTDRRISVNCSGKIIDELDNDFSQLIRRRRFAGEEESSWRYLQIRLVAQPVVKHNDTERVKQLTLVFMDAFDLAIEEAVSVYRLAGRLLEPIGKL